jgi:hypothetical protein
MHSLILEFTDGTQFLFITVHNPIFQFMWQEPGKAEAEFAKGSPELVIKAMLTGRNSGPLILPKEGLLSHPDVSNTKPLPSWLSQEDVAYYASKFEKSGFSGGLNYYRNLNL